MINKSKLFYLLEIKLNIKQIDNVDRYIVQGQMKGSNTQKK